MATVRSNINKVILRQMTAYQVTLEFKHKEQKSTSDIKQ